MPSVQGDIWWEITKLQGHVGWCSNRVPICRMSRFLEVPGRVQVVQEAIALIFIEEDVSERDVAM